MDELLCDHCGEDFARKDSLARHKRRKYPCDMDGNAPASDYSKCHSGNAAQRNVSVVTKRSSEQEETDIPCFDGSEFCGEKLKSRETLFRMMKHWKVPEHRWDHISSGILREEYGKRRIEH